MKEDIIAACVVGIIALIIAMYLTYINSLKDKLIKEQKRNIDALKDGIEIRNKMILLLQDRIEFYGKKDGYKHYTKQELEIPC